MTITKSLVRASAIFAAIALLTAVVQFAHAQDYPAKAVRIVVPFAPGGPNDLAVRAGRAKAVRVPGAAFCDRLRPRREISTRRLYHGRHFVVVHDQRERS
jgi:hypothetical protein